ncbi:isocitrate lyase/phosphoenolpyruvate mutase family protein [Pseudoduganella sp. LjRoot289]|uniref:isocitrate lyase/PEP mutase family protein n=1 Tax=Pseudoduganella sp. LjRoot289 TaxID=3342314 RepID=UPI003ECCD444
MNERLKTFRQLHDGKQLLRLANAWDAGSARLIESLGAPAIATTSAGVAWTQGYPDGGMPAELTIAAARNMARVLSVPLTVDIEDGYSADPRAVAEFVQRLVDSGVAGVNLEDRGEAPELMARKIDAIRLLTAQSGTGIFINARTDIFWLRTLPEALRVEETLARAAVYRAAGADGLFVPGIVQPDDIRAVAGAAGLPLNVMGCPGLPPAAELATLGVRRLSAGAGLPRALWGAARGMAQGFLDQGDTGPLAAQGMSYGELQQLFLAESAN